MVGMVGRVGMVRRVGLGDLVGRGGRGGRVAGVGVVGDVLGGCFGPDSFVASPPLVLVGALRP
ncbi:hypothetical protein ONO86_04035 [Micromonospora noduli]|nr:hypothetical protein ONO86_04035 [Micromonospora noduli]